MLHNISKYKFRIYQELVGTELKTYGNKFYDNLIAEYVEELKIRCRDHYTDMSNYLENLYSNKFKFTQVKLGWRVHLVSYIGFKRYKFDIGFYKDFCDNLKTRIYLPILTLFPCEADHLQYMIPTSWLSGMLEKEKKQEWLDRPSRCQPICKSRQIISSLMEEINVQKLFEIPDKNKKLNF